MSEHEGIVASSGGFCTNAIAFAMPRSEAIAYGLVEPSPEEAYEQARQLEEWRAESARTQQAMADYCARLDALTDPIARALLDLHAPKERDWTEQPECVGCDYAGWESESPGWPCRTVQLIGDRNSVEVPEGVWW